MFSYVSLEERVPQDHLLRAVRKLTDQVLGSLSEELDQLYSATSRRSIAPEYIPRALLLQVFYSIRSERQLVELLDYNLPFRWIVGQQFLSGAESTGRQALHERCGLHCRWHADPDRGLAEELPFAGRLR
jgi:transposase